MQFFKKLFIEKTGENLNPKDEVSKDNALNLFNKTLTQEEQDGPFLKLSAEKQHGYVKALALFQIEAMDNLDDAAMKAMNILAIRMQKTNTDSLEITQKFAGSKEEVKEEEFSLKIYKVSHVPKSDERSEYAEDGETNEPKSKMEPLWNQQYAVLDIIHQVKDQLPALDEKDLPFFTSGVLLLAEFMSTTSIETMDAGLENLIDKDTPLNVSFAVEAKRMEHEYYITPDNVGYTSRKPH